MEGIRGIYLFTYYFYLSAPKEASRQFTNEEILNKTTSRKPSKLGGEIVCLAWPMWVAHSGLIYSIMSISISFIHTIHNYIEFDHVSKGFSTLGLHSRPAS